MKDHDSGAPPRRRQTKPAEERRADLLEAAQRLFLGKGLAATSVDEIVAAAHVAKGTFYLYFDSKEAIFLALQERFVVQFFEQLQQALNRHREDNVRARLKTWVETLSTLFLEHVAVHDVVFQDLKPHDRRRTADNPVVGQLAQLLAHGHALGTWHAPASRLLAVMLFHALHGALDDAVMRGLGASDARGIARDIHRFFERALAPR